MRKSGLSARDPLALGLAVILGLTVYRLALLPLATADLFVDETQYWQWGQRLDWGYFSKPPLIGWVLRAVTDLAGSDSAFWIRMPGAVFHAATALLIIGAAREITSREAAVMAGLAYLTLPFVTEGEARVFGHDLRDRSPELLSRLGVVFQSAALDRKLSVRENLQYGGRMFGLRGRALRERIETSLAATGLSERATERVENLSGGLRRRAEIAKGLLHEPELLLLDEPSTGLDPGARRELWNFVRGLEGVTVLFTTHLMDEADAADQLSLMHEGRIVAEGTPEELSGRLGGDVVDVEPSGAADALAAALQTELGLDALVVDDQVRIEKVDGADVATRLLRELGDQVRSLRVGRPSLEDVFLHETGARFSTVDATVAPEGGSKKRRRK